VYPKLKKIRDKFHSIRVFDRGLELNPESYENVEIQDVEKRQT
jgi:hypothetical protein